MMKSEHPHLQATLGTVQLWAIAVGLVISGEYFGWNFGWATAGTLGFLVTTIFVATMYTAFIFSFTELTVAIPNAGGPFSYAQRAFGPVGGYFAGAATLVEFVFAPPAIALAIGSYLNVQFPSLSARTSAVGAYLLFMLLNIVGVQIAASFELVVTVLAIGELLVFMAVVSHSAHWSNFLVDSWGGNAHFGAHTVAGMFAAVPFAVWFFLAIEGVAMAAEEVRTPSRSIPIAYIAGMGTLLVLALGVMIFAGSVTDWHTLANSNDPLPQAMKVAVGARSGWLRMLVWLGLFGLVASFHAIILGYSRQIFALARAGFLPSALARIHPSFQTPWIAILAGGLIGIAAIYSDNFVQIGNQSLTANLVTMSAIGAIFMYILSMLALFRLRRTEPAMPRPFRALGYPLVPAWALLTATLCLISLIYYNHVIALLFVALLLPGYFAVRAARATAAAKVPDAIEEPR